MSRRHRHSDKYDNYDKHDNYDSHYLDRRRLRLDTRHKKIGGVCGGVANFFGWSRCTVRVLSVIALIFAPQVTLPVYGIAYLVMDRDYREAEYY